MTEISPEARDRFVPCPTCRQYSHSIGEDQLADAFNHFQSMYAHPVRGHPMGHNFDEKTRDAAQVLMAAARSTPHGADEGDRFYIDCEFDGHGGPLLSFAIVRENGRGIHIRTIDGKASDPWVIKNVIPLLDQHEAEGDTSVFTDNVGAVLRRFIGASKCPVIIADSPVDIGRFCQAISTAPDGGWASTDYPAMCFEVHNIDCYPTDLPGAVQHNAWWDAMALRHALSDPRTAIAALSPVPRNGRDETGRVEIRADDPEYRELELRPSAEAIAKIDEQERMAAELFAKLRHSVLGGGYLHEGEAMHSIKQAFNSLSTPTQEQA